MTIEAVNQFLTKVSQEQQLRAEVDRAIETGNARQVVTELAVKHGYEFTPEELASQFQNYQSEFTAQPASNELNEEELEAVAGGFCTPAIAIGVAGSVAGAGASAGASKW